MFKYIADTFFHGLAESKNFTLNIFLKSSSPEPLHLLPLLDYAQACDLAKTGFTNFATSVSGSPPFIVPVPLNSTCSAPTWNDVIKRKKVIATQLNFLLIIFLCF